MKVRLDKPIKDSGSTGGGGGGYTKPWHAFTGTITGEEQRGVMLHIYFKTDTVEGAKFDSFRLNTNGKYFASDMGKIAHAVATSSGKLDLVGDSIDIDSGKWIGLPCGAIYMPQDKNFGTREAPDWDEGPFSGPKTPISVQDVETYKPNMTLYNAWHAKHWDNSGEQASEQPATYKPPTPIDDDLPF